MNKAKYLAISLLAVSLLYSHISISQEKASSFSCDELEFIQLERPSYEPSYNHFFICSPFEASNIPALYEWYVEKEGDWLIKNCLWFQCEVAGRDNNHLIIQYYHYGCLDCCELPRPSKFIIYPDHHISTYTKRKYAKLYE